MKITPAATVIALLAASNVITGYVAIDRHREIRADHLQRIRLNTEGDGTIFITLGTSETPSGPTVNNSHRAATLALTPRAAIQLQVELSRTIQLVKKASQAQRVKSESRHPTL